MISKEELEYEYEIRTLKRKLEDLKKENENINNKLSLLKEKNDNLEYNINSYRNIYENNNGVFNEESKNNRINGQLIIMKYKRKLIDKVVDIYKKNILNFSFITNRRNKEDYSKLNMLLNLMDMKFIYENSILYDAFLKGVDLLYQTNFPKYSLHKREDKIIIYTNYLISQKRKLEVENDKYDNIKKYYILYQKFEGIKNLNEFLNKIIMKNIKVEQKINKIKEVLNFEQIIKGKEKENNNDNGINNSKIIKNILTRNKNKSINYDKYSFYNTNYENNKVSHYNYNNYNRNNNYLKYGKNTDKTKYNNVVKLNKNINSKTNLEIYNKNKDKNSLMKDEKLYSKSLNKKKFQKIL
jgi:hypothetical protein